MDGEQILEDGVPRLELARARTLDRDLAQQVEVERQGVLGAHDAGQGVGERELLRPDGRRHRFSCSASRVTPMAVPKRKVSPSRRNMRRSHHALGANSYVEDKDTGELRRPHHVDLKTGMYGGRQVITPKED